MKKRLRKRTPAWSLEGAAARLGMEVRPWPSPFEDAWDELVSAAWRRLDALDTSKLPALPLIGRGGRA